MCLLRSEADLMPALPENVPMNRQRTPCADKNDKLGWKAGFSVRLEGLTLGVRSNSPELLPALREIFPPQAQDDEAREVDVLLSFLEGKETGRKGVKNYHLVYDAWNRVARTMDFDEAMEALRASLEWNWHTHSKEKIYFDADVLTWQDRAVLVVGEKDERVAFVDTLRELGATGHCEQAVFDESLALADCREAGGNLSLALTIFTRKGKARRAKMDAPRAALELFPHAYAARYHPQRILGKVAGLSQVAPAVSTSLGDDFEKFVRRQLALP